MILGSLAMVLLAAYICYILHMVMLAMVLTSVGLPVDGIALVAGIDRIFDMGRTVVNITGDASCALVVSNIEKKKG